MGRIFGRKPDRTGALARAVRRQLAPDERVVAGVDVQTPGTTRAALAGGTSGAVAGALDAPPTVGHEDGEAQRGWEAEAVAMGMDAGAAASTVWASLVLTTCRLILLRRSKVTRRVMGPLLEWPVHEVDRIAVPRRGTELTVHAGSRALTFELAFEHRFRPLVYDELQERLERVQAQLRS